MGAWLNHDFDWHNHHLIVWGHDHPRPADWWFRRPGERPTAVEPVYHRATIWQPGGQHERSSGADRRLARGLTMSQASSPEHGNCNRGQPRPTERPAPVASQHPTEAPRSRPANGALIGVQSTHQTQQISTRGQECRQAAFSRRAPARIQPPRAFGRPQPSGRRRENIDPLDPMHHFTGGITTDETLQFFLASQCGPADFYLASRSRLVLLLGALLGRRGEQRFSSPQAAAEALKPLSQATDTNALHAIFGPAAHELVAADIVEAAAERELFMPRLEEKSSGARVRLPAGAATGHGRLALSPFRW